MDKYAMVVEIENGWISKAIKRIYRCNECEWFDEQEVCNKHGIFIENPTEFYCKDGEGRTE